MTRETGSLRTRAHATDVHQRAVELRLADIVAFLRDNLGPNLTAHMVERDERTVTRWAEESQKPTPSIERRLREAYHIFQVVQAGDSNHVARAWFMGMNPQLEDMAPLDVIREDRFRDAMSAARAFRAGG